MNADHRASDVTIPSKYTLAATICIPEQGRDRYPAVLLVPGSGQIDRNGTVKSMKLDLNLYRELAELIAGLGFVTLRYDKRGVGESDGEYLPTGMWDLVEDVDACVTHLRNHPSVEPERIFLLGHSEGCILGVAYAARHPLAGLILLAGGAERLEEALARQRQLLYDELLSQKGVKGSLFRLLKIDEKGERQAAALMDRIRQSTDDVIRVQFRPMNATWFREHLQYDILADLPKVACPVLALTGSEDIQSDPATLTRLPELVCSPLTWQVIGGMNHGLKTGRPKSMLNPKAAVGGDIGKPLHPQLIHALTGWLGAQ